MRMKNQRNCPLEEKIIGEGEGGERKVEKMNVKQLIIFFFFLKVFHRTTIIGEFGI